MVNSGKLFRVKELYYTQEHLNAKSRTENKNGWRKGWTPLHIALNIGNVEMARFLLSEVAPIDATNDELQTSLFFAVLQSHQDTEFEMVMLLLAF